MERVLISFRAPGSLVHSFPILLLAPLTKSTHHTLTKYTSPPPIGTEAQAAGMGHSWIAKSIYHNMVSAYMYIRLSEYSIIVYIIKVIDY